MRVSRRLPVAFLLIVLFPLLLAQCILYLANARSLTQRALSQLESVAAVQEKRLEGIRARNLERLALVSSRTQLRLSLAAFIEDGQAEHQAKMNRILTDALSSIGSFEEISVLMLDGRVAASTNPAAVGRDHSGDEGFLNGRTANSADTVFLDEAGELKILLSGPLRLDGKLLGVVVVTFEADTVLSVVSDFSGLGETGETVLARPDEDGGAVFLAPLRFDQNAALRRTVPREHTNTPIIQALSGEENLFVEHVDYRGEPVLAATRYVEGTGWGLVVKIDKAEALAPMAGLRRFLMALALVSTVAVVLIALWLERSTTRPIVDLLRAARRVAGGDRPRREDAKAAGEIGQLAKAFNETARMLERSRSDLARVNRALRVLSECNAALARATEEHDLLREVCRIVFDVGGYRLAWVGLAERDEAKTVRPVAQAGYEDGYLDTVSITWADTERGRGPTGAAIREGAPSIARHILTDPSFIPWRAEATKRGYASSIALPLVADGKAFGALNIYAAEPDAFDSEEVKLLTELAADLAYGVTALKTRAEHRRAVEALRQSEEKYRELVEKTNDIPYSLNSEGTVEYVGPQVERYGFSPESVECRSFTEFVHRDDRDKVAAALRETLSTGAEFVTEFRVEDTEGAVHWLEDLGKARRDESGKITGIGGILRDITKRKRLEAQLLQSQKMEAVGRLAGGVAHDFNNMMQVVTGYAQRLLKDLAPDDPRRRNAGEIKKAGERAARLTRQLLALGRRQVLQPRVLDVNAAVRGIEGMLQRALGDDIALVTVLRPELGRVKVDPAQLEQVIVNLAINARDAMPDGGKLTIETADVELGRDYPHDEGAVPPGTYVMLAVSDTGCGVDQETRSRIFEPFFTTKRPGEGTGLGLSTAYGTIRQSGGVIRVYSEPGEWTTFKIYLPRADEALEPEGAKQPAGEVSGGTETILLVEDDDTVRALLSLELRDLGYKVVEASNGSEAILRSKLHEDAIDLLVTDVLLPGRSGREVYEGVLAVYPGVRVIFMSGHTEKHIVHRGVLDPGTILLEKPFTCEQLASKVREALGGIQASRG